MCTVSINVDMAALRNMRPDLDTPAAVSRWAQEVVDRRMQQMLAESEKTMSIEEARAMVHAAIHGEYSKDSEN